MLFLSDKIKMMLLKGLLTGTELPILLMSSHCTKV